MSARTYPEGEPVRNKVTGQRGQVDWRSDDPPSMVIDVGGSLVPVQGEETWDWESLLGPG